MEFEKDFQKWLDESFFKILKLHKGQIDASSTLVFMQAAWSSGRIYQNTKTLEELKKQQQEKQR